MFYLHPRWLCGSDSGRFARVLPGMDAVNAMICLHRVAGAVGVALQGSRLAGDGAVFLMGGATPVGVVDHG